MNNDLTKIAGDILKERYLERTPYLSEEELEKVLKLVVKKSGKDDWRLVQHRNVEEKDIWYELEMSDGWDKSFYENLEWLNYIR